MIQYNLSGTWRTVKAVSCNVGGTWKTVGQVSYKVSGTWRNVWSYSWSTGSWGSCSATCGNGTQTRTVTCKRNDGQSMADSLCTKYVGAKPATSQGCNLGACEDCRYSTTDPSYIWARRNPTESCSPYSCYRMGAPFTGVNWNGAGVLSVCGMPSEATVDGYLYYIGDYVEDTSNYCGQNYKVCRKAV